MPKVTVVRIIVAGMRLLPGKSCARPAVSGSGGDGMADAVISENKFTQFPFLVWTLIVIIGFLLFQKLIENVSKRADLG